MKVTLSDADVALLAEGFAPTQDEIDALTAEVEASRAKLAAIRAEVEPWADRILRDRILEILDGPSGG